MIRKRHCRAPLGRLKTWMKPHGRPEIIMTDWCNSYDVALKGLGRGDDLNVRRSLNSW